MTTEIETPLHAAEDAFRIALAKRNSQLEVTKAAIGELAERTAAAGLYAKELQIIVGEKKFDVWFVEQKFDCTLAQAKAFIKFAERRATLSDSFRKTLLALPDVVQNETRESGDQKKPPKAECPWLAAIMKTTEQLNLAQELCPLVDWPAPHLITLEDSLRPLVELHVKLRELCAD